MSRLVPGDDLLLVVGDDLPRLEPRDNALERVVEVRLHDELALSAAREDRGLVREVCEVGAGEARAVAGHPFQVHVLAQRLGGGVHLEDLDASLPVGRRHEDLAVEAAGTKERLVELLQEVRGGHHDDVVLRVEAVHLDQQLIQGLVALAGDVRAARRRRRRRARR